MSLAKFIVYVRCDSRLLSRITALDRKRVSQEHGREAGEVVIVSV